MSKQEEGYVVVLINNGMYEYYDDFGIDLFSFGKLWILIYNLDDCLNVVFMFWIIDNEQFGFGDIVGYLLVY